MFSNKNKVQLILSIVLFFQFFKILNKYQTIDKSSPPNPSPNHTLRNSMMETPSLKLFSLFFRNGNTFSLSLFELMYD